MNADLARMDLTDLVSLLESEVSDLELLVEMMALSLMADEMPERQRALLERILR